MNIPIREHTKKRNILVTGGTVFVSRYVAEYFVKRGDNVFVLNRNSKPQSEGVTLLEADRNALGDKLKSYSFDAVIDVTAYTKADVENLVNALGEIKEYIFISSSAVYPETLPQPFKEEQKCGVNSIWGIYGTNKLEAERYLQEHVPQAYILRPPYIYGPMQNVYREGFVFDCAMADRTFYIPNDGSMKMQFFHVEDLSRFIDILLEKKPDQKIYNVGNEEAVTIKEWIEMCYRIVGRELDTVSVDASQPQRQYFCFHDYEYYLDVTKQMELMSETKPLFEGLQESFAWYREHSELVNKKPLMEYIDREVAHVISRIKDSRN